MSEGALVLAAASYALATLFFLSHVLAGRSRVHALACLGLAALLHTVSLFVRIGQTGLKGLAPLPEQLSAISWLAVLVYLLFSSRRSLAIIGALVAPFGLLAVVSAYAFEVGPLPIPARPNSVWLPIHIAPALLGYAIFVLASFLSAAYLLQEHQLKGRRRGALFRRLPALETLDELNHRFVSWGFVLFTCGIVAGSVLAQRLWGAVWSWEPVQVWSVVTWLVYAALLHARSMGWRGRRAAQLTIASFVVLVASFITVNLFFPGRHGM